MQPFRRNQISFFFRRMLPLSFKKIQKITEDTGGGLTTPNVPNSRSDSGIVS
jgi:hypothetical protein